MSAKERKAEARVRLAKAVKQWEGAATDAWEPPEPANCVTKCFYAYENGLTAAATALGETWSKNHQAKIELAKKLYATNKLKTDVSGQIKYLNQLRKNIQYDELSNEAEVDLEDLVSDLEQFLDEVGELIEAISEDDDEADEGADGEDEDKDEE